ncbi:MAG: helix-turn-helix domain-containing protein [Prevotella sp.]|jgi:DNA-binding Xre family transcriptional regulator|nr:helix-turn-helix transcriptional regulator [Prevotella sp.]MCH3993380.1 helix-turn-helix domain-containing protein [Prevotella sp.]MCI1474432.1 helix-turn-helix domain-containing protein [Prevotella sp.]MCI1549080.1 helix-turn-helix domain-containing protein [Prevotella sp.]MCI1596018.1 helix-turn-helix domain-containing protein [Prevotella sp.]MCI2088586.1 helix-turn-helix domain-containing protein [Prevotella sp.]
MNKISDRLNALAGSSRSNWLERAKWLEENQSWLKKSGDIALDIMTILRAKKISKTKLSESLGVSPQQMSKWLSGNENMTLSTICKIEEALGYELIQVTDPKELENAFIEEKCFSGSEDSSSCDMYTIVVGHNNTFKSA